METLKQYWQKAKEAVVGPAQPVVDSVVESTGMGSVASDKGVQQALGTAPETPGTTMTGGKRLRRHRTKRNHRKAKKTSKRKH